MGTFSRVRYVIAANMNALLEKAEDPEKLLRALIREMEDAGEDARLAAADLMAEQQHLERLTRRLDSEMAEWQTRAERAVQAGRDDLARAALASRAELLERQRGAVAEREALTGRVAQLETDMTTLKAKLAEAKQRLKQMHSQPAQGTAGAASATPGGSEASRSERKMRAAMNRFDRLQSQVERLEARVRSYEIGGEAESPWADADLARDPAIEQELEALKQRLAPDSSQPGAAEEQAAPEKSA